MTDQAVIANILQGFEIALEKLLSRDEHLLRVDVSERAITHKLAEHLQVSFEDCSVDCEYNRNGHEPKRVGLPDEENPDALKYTSTYPDIIVHTRGTNSNNLLIVEAKKSSDRRANGEKHDRDKLIAYARDLNYTVGVYIEFQVGEEIEGPEYRADCFYDGEWHDGLSVTSS